VARLRVIDLETGDQPIRTEDGSATVMLNGEIYDLERHRTALAARGHRFRSRSDTEVIAHASAPGARRHAVTLALCTSSPQQTG